MLTSNQGYRGDRDAVLVVEQLEFAGETARPLKGLKLQKTMFWNAAEQGCEGVPAGRVRTILMDENR